MKLNEKKIRKIIRKKIALNEYQAGRQEIFQWQTCERIDLPDKFVNSEGGQRTIKSAEKAAALAARVYGVPGFFCDILSELLGDNPNRKLNRDLSRRREEQQSRSLETGIYAKAFAEHNVTAQYITEMTQNISSTDSDVLKNSVDKDYDDFKRIKASIIAATRIAGVNPNTTIKEVNEELGLDDDKESVKIVKKLEAEGQVDNNQINAMIKDQAINFLCAVTLKNLKTTTISSVYRSVPGYNLFVNECND